jgi:hypothetical protein
VFIAYSDWTADTSLKVQGEEFLQHIKHNNAKGVKEVLKINLRLLLLLKKSEKSILHYALRKRCSAEIIKIMLDSAQLLGLDQLAAFQRYTDKNGYNILHTAAMHSTAAILQTIVDSLGSEARNEALKQNLRCSLPIESLRYNKNLDVKKTRKILKALSLDKDMKDLATPIVFSDLIANPKLQYADRGLLENLHYGCIAANYVRRKFKRSFTHPTINKLGKSELAQLEKDSNFNRTKFAILTKQRAQFNQTKDEKIIARIKLNQDCIEHCAEGRCGEYADAVLNVLRQMSVPTRFEIFEIKNGDHVFVVLGRIRDKNNVNTPSQWGPTAVVIDAWSGEVFPASEIEAKLRDFKFYESAKHVCRGSITFPYNPKFHELKVQDKFSKFFESRPRVLNYSQFSPAEIAEIEKNSALIDALQQKPSQLLKC